MAIKISFNKFLKGIALILSLILVVVFTIYTIAWFTFTKRAEAYLNAMWQNKADFTITGDQPRFSGYPLVPTAKFSGTIEHISSLKITTPELIFTGFPAPHQTQILDAPHGIQISSNYLERDLNFDYAYLQFTAPRIPYSDKREDVAAWQQAGHQLIIQNIVLQSGKIYAHGSGTMGLDENLQLSADITARVVGMETLFDAIAAEKGEKTIAIARNFFDMLSQVDEKTGEKYFETTLKIQNRGLYFGPMRISGLPEIKWRSEQPPAVPSRSPLNRLE